MKTTILMISAVIAILLLVACQPMTVVVEVTPEPGTTAVPNPVTVGLDKVADGVYRFYDNGNTCYVYYAHGISCVAD